MPPASPIYTLLSALFAARFFKAQHPFSCTPASPPCPRIALKMASMPPALAIFTWWSASAILTQLSTLRAIARSTLHPASTTLAEHACVAKAYCNLHHSSVSGGSRLCVQVAGIALHLFIALHLSKSPELHCTSRSIASGGSRLCAGLRSLGDGGGA